jgi:two-component system cell cycle response regulator CpdR
MARLLVVEDDNSVRELAARALERAGHSVETASDGEEGLSRIVEAEGGYDLVVSDIRMPAMDGIEMSQKAVARYPGLKIMLVTGFADQRERAEELDGVIVDVLLKPFSLASIRDTVAKNLAFAPA